jgi:2,3-bisphosphoglycerate-dependent phosphoglycerate mutase
MPHLILVRHGQSEWNLEKRFTGWVDVDLTGQGKLEACKAGEYVKKINININHFYSSFQLRAIKTLKLIQETLRDQTTPIKAWQLNERHYGSLTGLNKDQMKEKLGEEKIHKFRRSWDIKPEPLNKNNPYHPLNIEIYKNIPKENIPDTESLKDTYERVMKFYDNEIQDKLQNNENILISAHGNSIRALCKFLFKLDNDKISLLEIPTGNPLLINLDKELNIKECFYLDKERAKDLLVF